MKDATITLLFGLLTALILPFVAFRYHKLFTILRFISDWPPNQYEHTPCEDNEVTTESEQEVVEVEESPQEAVEVEELTNKSIIEEAIGGICYLGVKKTEAKKAVNRVCNNRVFTDAEELIKAALDRSNV
tara:strand:- start:785 stop:1174 length:390 start_codon:yes stop_codon:yes gene_type:complete